MTKNTQSFLFQNQNPLIEVQKILKVITKGAYKTDQQNTFPTDSIGAMRSRGLMGLLIPQELNGYGANPLTYLEVSRTLGGACLSTAMIWAMHCQQVAVLIGSNTDVARKCLSEVAQQGNIIGSITTEKGKGGHLFTINSPLIYEGSNVVIDREAPIVTAVEHAGAYIVMMRASPDSTPAQIALVLVNRDQSKIVKEAQWCGMGMRGTASHGVQFNAIIPANQILAKHGFADQILRDFMIPVGHLGWASCWLGAAEQVLRELISSMKEKKMDQSEREVRFRAIGNAQIELSAVYCQLTTLANAMTERWSNNSKTRDNLSMSDGDFHMLTNAVKVFAARTCYEVTNRLVYMLGLVCGYTSSPIFPAERLLRDLRAASLMFHDERLISLNGRLSVRHISII